MKSIQITSFGDLEQLKLVDLPDPKPGPNEALVQIHAASVNPSDVKNVQGAMHQTTLPRIPGRDYAGVVVAGPSEWMEKEVWGTGGELGFTRDGTHAELVGVPVESLRQKPKNLCFDQAATVGVSYMAAWLGVVEVAEVKQGETIAIIGAGGAVGGAAAQIAKRIGAKVVGVDRNEPHPEAPIRMAAESLIVGAPDVAAAIRQATGGRGADVVFDMVGGAMFRASLASLAFRGRQVAIASVGAREVAFDLIDFYHNESRLFGVDTLKRGLVESAKILEALTAGFEEGAYLPAPIEQAFSLSEAAEAYKCVADGARGRIVLRPQG